MEEKTYNTRVSLTLGLQNDYGVFTLLNNGTTDAIGVEIITDGILYVEDEASSIVHGGSSTWKDFEGVKDVSSDVEWTPSNTIYGSAFVEKIKKYFTDSSFPLTAAFDIYLGAENYKNYKNQFSISFKLDNLSHGTADTYYKYFDSKLNEKESIPSDGSPTKQVIKGLLYYQIKGDTSDHYIYLNADIIHFSKYYSIYKNSTMLVPCLLPVLYTADDLEKYNLFTASERMYVQTLSIWTQWGDDMARYDGTRTRQYKYNADSADGHFNLDHGETGSYDTHDDDEWNLSQFRQCQYGLHHPTEIDEETADIYNNYFPKGFTIFSFKDEKRGWALDPTNNNSTASVNVLVPNIWKTYFESKNYNYRLSDYGIADADGDANNKPALCALYFRGDSADNVHLLNCWFTLNASGANSENRKVQLTVALKSTAKKPTYIGMWIASVFCNIYHYVDSTDYNANIIQDIIYLSPHYTTYTKDITYYLKAPRNEQGVIDDSIIAFNPGGALTQPIQFGGPTGYVALLKKLSGANDAEINGEYNSSDKNVKLFVRDCIKTIPLQYRLPYREPDTSIIGADDSIYVLRRVGYPDKRMYSNGKLNKTSLYLVNEEGDTVTVDFLGKNFRIRYFQTIDCDYNGTKILNGTYGNYEDDIVDMSDLWHIEEDLMLRNSKYTHPASNYYGIVGYGDNHDKMLGDLDKRETLVPFAKFV